MKNFLANRKNYSETRMKNQFKINFKTVTVQVDL